MPVGTKATVKSLDPDELRALGAPIVLGNTYHLHFRPGEEVIAELGGLHAFMGWDGPILTDSGGFQVFSLRDTLLAVDDDGVTFRSVYDGDAARFTPEDAAEIQRAARLGRRDVPRRRACRADASRARAGAGGPPHDAVGAPPARRTARARSAPLRDRAGRRRRRAAAAVDRGDRRARLRRQRDRRARDRRDRETRCSRRPRGRPQLLPADRPRYFMGIGDPEGVLEVIAARRRHVRLRAADAHRAHRQRADVGGAAEPPERPLRPRPRRRWTSDCRCPACARFSRAYIRHLVNQQELLGLRLLSLHNLRFLIDLTSRCPGGDRAGRRSPPTARTHSTGSPRQPQRKATEWSSSRSSCSPSCSGS